MREKFINNLSLYSIQYILYPKGAHKNRNLNLKYVSLTHDNNNIRNAKYYQN